MKKYIIFWSITILSIIIAIGFYLWLMTSNNIKPPTILPNIPKSATWIGGADEGFWFDIVEINKEEKVYRFKIYNDYKGDLVLDADFKKDSACNKEYYLDKRILEKIIFFNFDKIGLTDNCELNMIQPGYNGTFLKADNDNDP
ncbi:MAG: hypothetical protein P8P29_06125 [Flavobacteriaceae bacterium]|nr:hypothetical protein [Flavobacteriaceae bacterium]